MGKGLAGAGVLSAGSRAVSKPSTSSAGGTGDNTEDKPAARGANVVYKQEPYLPEADEFGRDEIKAMSDDWNFNFVRFGLQWAAIEPEKGVFDTGYLDRVEDFVSDFADEDIYVVLDMHQDLYGHLLGGDGAPDWAVNSSQESLESYDYDDVAHMWQENYLKPAVSEAFKSFWENEEEIQNHYIRSWMKAAENFSGNRNVIGYELMNEPVPPLNIQYTEMMPALREFEKETLPEFYNRAINGIREVDSETPIWIEPSAASFNLGLPTSLEGVQDPAEELVFSYHNYAPIFGDLKHKLINWNARDASQRLSIPAVMTEFSGGTTRPYMEKMTDQAEETGGWSYWQFTERGGGWTSEAEKPNGDWGLKHGKGRIYHEVLSTREQEEENAEKIHERFGDQIPLQHLDHLPERWEKLLEETRIPEKLH
ncbi:MAG: glycoside hydrolase family 5 protein [Candidatus Nanohalobium sp.]